MGPLPPNTWLVTLDVSQLSTNIDNSSGLHAAKEALHEFRPSNDLLIQLLEFVLTKNNFQFNGDHYLQTGGTSMGTKTALAYANAFMGKFKEDFVYTYPTQPLLWKSYIDDFFYIWTGTKQSLDQLITYLNGYDLHIKYLTH